jgi:hypothetical protein
MKSSEQAYDDLTAIKGIGPARQRWLRESLHVRTYEDFAALSIGQIASQLKADGQIVSRSVIEAWLVKAGELAASAGRSATPHLESAGAKVANSPAREDDDWKPFASMVVEFQIPKIEGRAGEYRTKVAYMEGDAGESWPGIESKLLCQWMLDHIRDKVGLELEEYEPTQAEPAEAPSAARVSAKVKIRQMRVFQPPQSETPILRIEAGKPSEGSVKGDKPFTIEVDFEVSGLAAVDKARKQIECGARSYAYELAKGTSILLSDTGPNPLKAGKSTYTFTLPEATLKPGSYRLWVIMTTQAALVVPDYLEVLRFRVL